VNGFVLAGGRSTRMGQDKALLPYAGRPLVEHAVQLLRAVGLEPHILGNRHDLSTCAPVMEDLHPACGPLGGIEAALTSSNSDWNVFVPVDLPLLPPTFLRYLIERSTITGAAATIPTVAGRPNPLCAVYHRSLLAAVSRVIAAGNNKVIDVVAADSAADLFSVEAVAATREDWPVTPPLHLWFQNLNTREDMWLIS